MCLSLPFPVWTESLLRSALVGVLRKGLFLCDGKTTAADFLGICLIKFLAERLFESLSVKPCAKNRSPADNVFAKIQFFRALCRHF